MANGFEALKAAGDLIKAQAKLIDQLNLEIKRSEKSQESTDKAIARLSEIVNSNALTTTGPADVVGAPLTEEANPSPATDAAIKVISEVTEVATPIADEAVAETVDTPTETPAEVLEAAVDELVENAAAE